MRESNHCKYVPQIHQMLLTCRGSVALVLKTPIYTNEMNRLSPYTYKHILGLINLLCFQIIERKNKTSAPHFTFFSITQTPIVIFFTTSSPSISVSLSFSLRTSLSKTSRLSNRIELLKFHFSPLKSNAKIKQQHAHQPL